jgi:hypothetical protein
MRIADNFGHGETHLTDVFFTLFAFMIEGLELDLPPP